MSNTARQFLIRRNWCDWQFELHRGDRQFRGEQELMDQYARVKRDAAYLIGWLA